MKKIYCSFLILNLTFFTSVVCSAADSDPFEGYFRKPFLNNCISSPTPPNYRECFPPTEEGVEIKRRNKASYYIHISTKGDNGHFCSYQGIAHLEGKFLVSVGNDCKVTVEIDGDVADLDSVGNGCINYCGARAHLFSHDLKRKGLTLRSSGTPQKRGAP